MRTMFYSERNSELITSNRDSDLLDAPTPRHSLLSGRFKQSFAYLTLRTRMPGIMQQIIMHLKAFSPELEEQFGEDALKDVKTIGDAIERLKNELNRDRQFTQFHGNEPDKAEWNRFLSELPYPKRTYFRACWLHAECYLYRRMHSFFENSKVLKTYDYFADLKQEDLKISVRAMKSLVQATRHLERNWDTFSKLMRINLWSNHYEIQLNAFVFNEAQNLESIDVMARVADLDRRLLVDDSALVWNSLLKAKKEGNKVVIVDYIMDNAGFELFTDLLFIEYLVDTGLATEVRLHVKAIPWYISDVTKRDVEWTIDFLIHHPNDPLAEVGRKWAKLMAEGRIKIAKTSHFWTGPQSYFVMLDVDLELYKQLASAHLAIFKGDLNYRKLLGDYIWDSSEDFITCLRGFRPCGMCAMRTVKCEVVCGLPQGTSDNLLKIDPQWMISGSYGVIQYTDSLKCACCLMDLEEESCSKTSGCNL